MGNVRKNNGAYFISNSTDSLVIPIPAVCRSAADDHLWFFLFSDSFEMIIIYCTCFFFYAKDYCMVCFATEVCRAAMCEMSSHTQIKSQYFFTRFHTGKKYSSVCLGTPMRLHIGQGCIEFFFQPFNSDCFYFIYYFASAII